VRITVLGLGLMGRAVTTRLLDKGHDLTVWNRSPGKADEVVKLGAVEARSIAQAVENAQVVLTLLTNDDAVKPVCLGDGGAVPHLPQGAILVDMSTVHPDTSRELAAAVPGGRFVDAPILGGPEAVVEGRAKYLVAGEEDTVKRLDGLFNDLGAAYIYTGPNGTATTLKLLSNLILVGSTELLAEAIVTGQSAGLSNDVLREVFGQSPAVAPGVKVRLEDVLQGDHDGWWTLELADKDMRLILKLASGVDVSLPVGAATQGIIRRAIEAGYGEKDLGAVTEALRIREPAAAGTGKE
jgi:3-hydroxyisobutyrate dehydrogenase-like beta-hydroxyacid dehydrogenase